MASSDSCCWPCAHDFGAKQSSPELVKLRRYFYAHLLGFILPICLGVLGFFLFIFALASALGGGVHKEQSAHLVQEQSAASSFPHWIPSVVSSSLSPLASSLSSLSSSSSTELIAQKQVRDNEGMKNPDIETQRTSDTALGGAFFLGIVLWFGMPLVALGFSLYASISVYKFTCAVMEQDAMSLPLSHSPAPLGFRVPSASLRLFNIGQLVAMCVGWAAFGLVFLWSSAGFVGSAWLCELLQIVSFVVYTAFYYVLLDRLYLRFSIPTFSPSHLPIPDAFNDDDTTVGYREGEVDGLKG